MGQRLMVVVVPGLNREVAHWEEMGGRLRAASAFADYDEWHWRVRDHELGLWSRKRLEAVARELESWINDRWLELGRPDDIILAGHSMGALLVRQAWLNCVDPTQGSDHSARDWGRHVRRFVLFAGISRGVDVQKPFWRRIGSRLLELVPGRFTFEECMRGSAFITNLRLSWMRHLATLDPADAPAMVQLLGTRDDLVAREDSLDVDLFPSAAPINITGAHHGDLHHLAGVADAAARLDRFREAFCAPVETHAAQVSAARAEQDVLLIVHGIRASRVDDWVRRARDQATRLWPGVVAVAPTYGYLSALRFALPHVRKRYGQYFRDFYTEVLCKHRNARVSVLCHSNGTYALGHSLREFDAIRIQRAALAGSVLPSDFDWQGLINSGRVSAVRSDGGDVDWPVGLLCNGLRGLMMRDVGTGGFDGFVASDVDDVRFHRGGHSCMLGDDNIRSMIGFLKGEQYERPITSGGRSGFQRLSRLMKYLVPVVAILLVGAIVYSAWTWGWLALAAAIAGLVLVLILLDIF